MVIAVLFKMITFWFSLLVIHYIFLEILEVVNFKLGIVVLQSAPLIS